MPKSPKKTERDAALVADFLAGMPSRELAAKYGITRQRVSHITMAAGVRRDKVFVLSERVRRMIEAAPALAAEGLTKSAAARRLGVTHSHFVQVVARHLPNLEWQRHKRPRSPHVQRMVDAAPALAAEGLSQADAARRLGVLPKAFTPTMARHLPDLQWRDGRSDGKGGRRSGAPDS